MLMMVEIINTMHVEGRYQWSAPEIMAGLCRLRSMCSNVKITMLNKRRESKSSTYSLLEVYKRLNYKAFASGGLIDYKFRSLNLQIAYRHKAEMPFAAMRTVSDPPEQICKTVNTMEL